ncbi:MAG: MoxR family ATPase [Clostridiales bacterium]|nr:MoxR family ATPase [Clostridiales bacterium]MDR2713723.1 MoxR family ATPase [Clostridiales bacterium]
MNIPEKVTAISQNIGKVLLGKEEAISLALIALACQGHVLIEDAPGLGKTTLALGLAKSLGCSFGRIQFTPDLLPSDITGFNMYDLKSGAKTFVPGGIMHQMILADEINRTSPKTQAALLEAMQEGQVTVDGQTIPLPVPFMVMATQNPLEFAGTYPLPEAQMDRFFLRIRLGYPKFPQEYDILTRHQTGSPSLDLSPVIGAEDILAMQRQVYEITVSKPIKQYIASIAGASRHHGEIQMPVSPRGSIALMRASMAYALLCGRSFVLPDDVQKMVVPVLAHRLALYPAARAKKRTGEDVLQAILTSLPVPAAS